MSECNCTDPVHGGKLWACVPNPNMCPIQNNCKYGYVLPDRCRYNSITGCDCGAYPPVRIQNARGQVR